MQDPVILEELDFLYKSDCARKMVFYYQVCPRALEFFLRMMNIIEQPEETGQDRDDIAALKATKKAQRSIAAMNLKAKPKTRGSSSNTFRHKRPSHCFLARGAQAFHNRPKVNPVVGKVYRFPQDEHKTVKSC